MDLYEMIYSACCIEGQANHVSSSVMKVIEQICRCSLEDDDKGIANLSAALLDFVKSTAVSLH